jgi:DNA-binding NtrC family response regulator
MDEEEGARRFSKQILSQLGYEPELANNGAETIELYKESMDSGQPFDLVILNLTVKAGMGGKDTVKKLQELYPQVKAIVSSGYSDDPVMTNFTVYGFTGILPKPNTKKELIEMLKKITKE